MPAEREERKLYVRIYAAAGGKDEKEVIAVDTDIKIVRLHRFEGDSKLKAFVDIAIGEYIVKGLRIVNGEKGLFLSMPREQGKDGNWYDTLHPVTKEARTSLQEMVLAAYQQ